MRTDHLSKIFRYSRRNWVTIDWVRPMTSWIAEFMWRIRTLLWTKVFCHPACGAVKSQHNLQNWLIWPESAPKFLIKWWRVWYRATSRSSTWFQHLFSAKAPKEITFNFIKVASNGSARPSTIRARAEFWMGAWFFWAFAKASLSSTKPGPKRPKDSSYNVFRILV